MIRKKAIQGGWKKKIFLFFTLAFLLSSFITLVNAQCPYTNGTDMDYSGCSVDSDCIGDWTCVDSNPEDIYEASDNSYCMDNDHCCWEFEFEADCNVVMGASGDTTYVCQRDGDPDPPNFASNWCEEDTGAGDGDGDGNGAGGTPSSLNTCIDECESDDPQGAILHLIRFSICIFLRLLQLLAIIAAVIAMVVSGIMWITTDNPSRRDSAKNIFMFALLGIVVVMIVIQLINAFLTNADIAAIACEMGILQNEGIYDSVVHVACVLFKSLQIAAILLAAVIITVSGIIWMGSDSAEERVKARNLIIHTILGLLIVMLAIHLLGSLIAPEIGYTFNCEGTSAPQAIANVTDYVGCLAIRIFQFVAILLAIAIIALSGVRYLLSDSAEARNKAKNMVMYTLVGFLVVFTAISLVNVILGGPVSLENISCGEWAPEGQAANELSTIQGQIHATGCIIIQIVNLTAAVIAALILALAGVMYFTSDDPGSKNRAKQIFAQVVIGLVLILIASNLISAILAGSEVSTLGDLSSVVASGKCGEVISDESIPITDVSDPINKVLCVILTIFQQLSGLILLLVVVAAGFMWAASDNPDQRLRAKRMIIYGILGILVILLATNVVWALLSAVTGSNISFSFVNPFGADNCNIDSDEVNTLVGLVESLGCTIFLLLFLISGIVISMIIVYAGLRWIVSDSPEDRNVAKWMIIKAIIGFIFIQVASQMVMAFTNALVTMDMGGGVPWASFDDLFNFLGAVFGTPYIVTCWTKIGLPGGALGMATLFGQLWFIFCYLLRMIQVVAIAAAAIIIVWAGLKWIGSDSYEDRSYARSRILHALVGLIIVLVATSLVDALTLLHILSDVVPGLDVILEALKLDELYDFWCPGWSMLLPENLLFTKHVQYLACLIVRILQGVAAALATVVILLAGLQWMSSDSYETRKHARDRILHALIGLLIVVVTLQLVNAFLTDDIISSSLQLDCGDVDTGQVVDRVNTLGCIIVRLLETIAAMVAAVLLVFTGYKWMTSEAPEERSKARRRIITILVGLFITILAFQLVQIFVTEYDVLHFGGCSPGSVSCDPASSEDGSLNDEAAEAICTARYFGCVIIRILMFIVGIVATTILMYIGIRWTVTESPQDRSRLKSWFVAVFIALILLMIVFQLVNSFLTGTRILSVWC